MLRKKKRQIRNNKIKRDDLNFMAGLFEGEGSIKISSRGRGELQITIGNTDPSLLKLFKSNFKVGAIGRKKRRTDGKGQIYKSHRWICSSYKASQVLKKLSPFFKSKRKKKEAKLGVEFQKVVNDYNHFLKYTPPLTKALIYKRKKMFLEMRALKSYGKTKW